MGVAVGLSGSIYMNIVTNSNMNFDTQDSYEQRAAHWEKIWNVINLTWGEMILLGIWLQRLNIYYSVAVIIRAICQ